MREVARACFQCLYHGDDDIHVKPENPGLTHLNDGHTEYEQADGPCEVCGDRPSLKRA